MTDCAAHLQPVCSKWEGTELHGWGGGDLQGPDMSAVRGSKKSAVVGKVVRSFTSVKVGL